MFLVLVTQGSRYHYCKTSSNKDWTQVVHRLKSCLWYVRDSRWWGSSIMVVAEYKATCRSLVNHTTKTIHYYYHSILILMLEFKNCSCSCGYSIIVTVFFTKTKKKTKKIFNTALTPLLWATVLFFRKRLTFCKKMLVLVKLLGP